MGNKKSKQRVIKIAVTGGGSGGHVEPLVAVIRELKKQTVEIIWIGQANSFESRAAEKEQIIFKPIIAGKLRRYFTIQNAIDASKVIVGYIQALGIFLFHRPDVIFSKAGYVSVPALLAAATLRIPIVAHESDTVIGLANHIASIVADRFCTGFPLPFYSHTFAAKTVFTGNPVSVHESTAQNSDKIPVIYVTGGSQGALTLNEVMWDALPLLLSHTRIFHAVGASHVLEAQKVYDGLPQDVKDRYIFSGYFDQEKLSDILSTASLAIGRAGAGTIADFSEYGIPAILVPLPTAASNHQHINAQFVADRGAGILLAQVDLTTERLIQEVTVLLDNKAKRKAIGEAMQHINPEDAAAKIAHEIFAVVKGYAG